MTSGMTLAVCCLLFVSVAPAAAQETSLGGPRQKITTTSAVRARNAPVLTAAEVTRLKLGTVLSADARSEVEAEVGSKKDYWYRVALPDGRQAWVFGGLLADYDPARREEIVRRIVGERLKAEGMSFEDGVDLYNFVVAALPEAGGAAKGELELARLHALDFAAAGIAVDEQGRPLHSEFQKAHGRELYHHELAGRWAVKAEVFWQLETKYRGSVLGDRIAWDAAQALRPGECEGDEVCNLLAFHDTQGRYLGLYPTGAHAAEALQNLREALASQELDASLKSKGGDEYARQAQEALKKALAELRATVAKAEGPDKAAILRRLEQLSTRATG